MALVTGVTLPNNGDRIKAENYNDPITKILAQVNGNLDSTNIAAGTLPWSVMSSITNQIPAAAMQDEGNVKKFRDEANLSFVVTGLVWSASAGLDGTMTAGTIYTPDGTRAAVSSIATKTFTASRDTYVDVSPAGVVTYNEVVNGATPPPLTADYTRIAIVITSGAAITAVHSTAKREVNGYTELGRMTLGVAGAALTVPNLPAKKYLQIIVHIINNATNVQVNLRFNADSGNNYALRLTDNGAADGTFTTQPEITLAPASINSPHFSIVDVVNTAAQEKLVTAFTTIAGAAGAGNLPSRRTSQSKWANTANLINRVDVVTPTAVNYAAGSELIVLGRD